MHAKNFPTPEEHPPLMRFKVPDELVSLTKIYNVLPNGYEQFRIPSSKVEFTQGPFGVYFTQELIQKDWVIGWLDFMITSPVFLFPNTAGNFVGVYCGLEGDILCELQGQEQKLTLPADQFGFYYVPKEVMNKAEFEAFHYRGMYLSLSSNFLEKFVNDKRAEFGELIEKQMQGVMRGEQVHVISLNEEARSTIKSIRRLSGSDPDFMVTQDMHVTKLLLAYFRQLQAGEGSPRMQKALDYIHGHFTEKIDIKKLLEITGMSEEVFKRELKEVTGFPLDKYVKEIRLKTAEHRVLTTQDPHKKIAADMNFSNESHFNKAFKHKYGITPEEYRKKHSK